MARTRESRESTRDFEAPDIKLDSQRRERKGRGGAPCIDAQMQQLTAKQEEVSI